MWCPQCGAEYREGFTACSDCQVALVSSPPSEALADAATPEASFALLWSGNDAGIHAEICDALERKNIPARTLGREDHLFSPTMRPEFEVYVPAGLMSVARDAVHQADPTEEDSGQTSDSQQLLDSGILEIPAEDQLSTDLAEDDERADRLDFDPRDATVEIWSDQDADMVAMIASSLRENYIPCRADPDISNLEMSESNPASGETSTTTLFVFPEDENRAKEIIREIVDATPPK